MKKHTLNLLALCVLSLCLAVQALAQSLPVNLMGTNNADIASGMAILPSGASVFGGTTFVPNQGSKSGLMIWESATNFGSVDFAKSYSLGTADLQIQAVEAAQPSGTVAVVANRTNTGTNSDGLFMHLSATGTVLGARAFNSVNDEVVQNVKCLSDGSFLVLGSIENPATQMRSAFVTRIGSQAQGYSTIWSRVLGTIFGNQWTFDYAVAADQYSDGSILVAGFTDQGSASTEGSVFLWKLSSAGADLALNRYTMSDGVHRPFPSDMRITTQNSVEIIGNSLDEVSNFVGFHMRLTPTLGSAVFTNLTFADYPSTSLELKGLDFRGSNKPTWASGTMRVVDPSGPIDQRGLIVEFSGLTGLMRAHEIDFTGDDIFTDVRLDASNNVRVSGLSNKPTSGLFNVQGTNVINVRTSTLGLNCLTTDVSLLATPHPVLVEGFGLGTANPVTIVVSPITPIVSTISAVGLSSCVDARYGTVEATEEPAEAAPLADLGAQPKVYPNPASGTTTLRLPAYEQPTPVHVYDLAGKCVRALQATGTETQLELGGLTPGLYIVAVQSAGSNHRLKLMVD